MPVKNKAKIAGLEGQNHRAIANCVINSEIINTQYKSFFKSFSRV